jgi:proteasome lid subunit RPN8/RPN11
MIAPTRISLSAEQLGIMRDHVNDSLPIEACGLVGGAGGEVEIVIPVTNAAQSATEYRMDPKEQVEGLFRIEELGYELLGIFHSHPSGLAFPSRTDISRSAYPGAVHLIWSPGEAGWQCRAFNLDTDGVRELEIEVRG